VSAGAVRERARERYTARARAYVRACVCCAWRRAVYNGAGVLGQVLCLDAGVRAARAEVLRLHRCCRFST
jgi:hypothetical protein